MIDNFSDQTSFPQKFSRTDRQVANLCKAFSNNPTTCANIKQSKTNI